MHLDLRLEGTHFVLRDVDSVNGTRVDGQPVREVRLAPGQSVAIGQSRLRVEEVKAIEDEAGWFDHVPLWRVDVAAPMPDVVTGAPPPKDFAAPPAAGAFAPPPMAPEAARHHPLDRGSVPRRACAPPLHRPPRRRRPRAPRLPCPPPRPPPPGAAMRSVVAPRRAAPAPALQRPPMAVPGAPRHPRLRALPRERAALATDWRSGVRSGVPRGRHGSMAPTSNTEVAGGAPPGTGGRPSPGPTLQEPAPRPGDLPRSPAAGAAL